LDIRFILANSNIEKFTDLTISILKAKFPGEIPKDIHLLLKQIFNIFLQTIIVEKQMKELKTVELRYKSSVESISKLDPFIAYKLSGKQAVYNYIDYLNEYTSKIDEISKRQISDFYKEPVPDDLDEFKNKIKYILHPKLYESAMKVITDDIKEVGSKLSLQSRKQIRKIIGKQDSYEIDTDLENLIEGYLKSITSL
jgi:hypothetical protein